MAARQSVRARREERPPGRAGNGQSSVRFCANRALSVIIADIVVFAGVDAALEPAHHLHRWRAGPEAAKAAREVVTIAKSDAPALPVASVPASKLNHPPQAVKRDERVEKALETLGRAEMKQEKAGAKPALTGEGAAKKAIAVWELLDAQKRVREEKGRAKKPGAGRGLGLRR